jgi:glycosyltransferase involved in cell wall biosynthesis
VLTVGAIGLRKGSPYVLAAAKQLKDKAVFRMVGSIGVTSQAEAQLREHLELTGPVPRSDIAKHFAWADIFLLPSICEGSATVTYEALGYGLPVICTPSAGSVVRDGLEGFIVPLRDATAIAGRIDRLAQNVELRSQMAAKAKARATEFTVEAYGQRLLAAFTGAMPLQEPSSA